MGFFERNFLLWCPRHRLGQGSRSKRWTIIFRSDTRHRSKFTSIAVEIAANSKDSFHQPVDRSYCFPRLACLKRQGYPDALLFWMTSPSWSFCSPKSHRPNEILLRPIPGFASEYLAQFVLEIASASQKSTTVVSRFGSIVRFRLQIASAIFIAIAPS